MYNIGEYFKAAAGGNCPANHMVATREECEVAGLQLGHPFEKEDAKADSWRPAGWFWDQNRCSYFNIILDTTGLVTRNGVGAICKKQGRSPS